jgi:hypothetical protein
MLGGCPRASGGAGGFALGAGLTTEIPIADRFMGDGELKDAVEEQPSIARMPPVEAEDELVEILAEIVGLNGTLVGAEDPTFGERCETVHARQHQRCMRTPGTT